MGKKGFAVGSKRKYGGDGWSKKNKYGRWKPVTRESVSWSKPASHHAGGGCLVLAVLALGGLGALGTAAAAVAHIL